MERDWGRLGSLLRADRTAQGLTQDEVGSAIGVHRNTVRAIEDGTGRRITPSIRAYAREVGWSDGSVEAVLDGGEPARPASRLEMEAASRLAELLIARLPQRVLQELSDGHIVDSDVVDLRPDGSAAVLSLVLERGADLPAPEQVREDLRRWSHVQRDLRRAASERQPEASGQ
ncbi:helix-turn-helix domain-containing protein [Kitasatospora cheerisanensis]|uniref:HTH cro/C1-type domain-containing protein n=1 Tax=Kitasatospora cheerisanensis KCTC 2395 TaxID=1348663 RepID=A0A066YZC3_9ACTN|nr:helix-turn-helix domain-containing protein [Kitasatospora cheerisanensis]KDN83441.1 hypothetical protein KCH_49230 [Kitasatospora cheerisanensis KCTC 2395]